MLQLEVATWSPKHRVEVINRTAVYFEKHGPLPVKMCDPYFKPGPQQLWLDICSNRAFLLFYNQQGHDHPKQLFESYKPEAQVMNSELINIIEMDEVLKDAGQALWGYQGAKSLPESLPKIEIELTSWLPEHREEVINRTAGYFKKHGPLPLKMSNPYFKPGPQQLWLDTRSNRSFLLYYNRTGYDQTQPLFEAYKPMLDIMNFELINVIEMDDVLENAGKAFW